MKKDKTAARPGSRRLAITDQGDHHERRAQSLERRLKEPDFRAIRESLLDFYRSKKRSLPWRKTADPYAIWVSEVMLQQTRVETVVPYWERCLTEFPTVHALA